MKFKETCVERVHTLVQQMKQNEAKDRRKARRATYRVKNLEHIKAFFYRKFRSQYIRSREQNG